MTIDAHVHFWKYHKQRDGWITDDMKILKQDYLPEHLALTLKRNGIDGVVAVQVEQAEVETHFLDELAKTHPVIKAVVGWVDLLAPNLPERLDYFSQYPMVKGFRHIVQAEADDFLDNPRFREGVRLLAKYNYTYDILLYERQLPAALKFIEACPDQKLIIDHCAKPDIRNHKLDPWRQHMKEAAQHPQVFCKLSGLFTEAAWKNWSAADFYPYLDVVFEAFGADRLLYGSDWPVMLLSGIYVQWKSLLEKYMENMEEEQREKLFGENARGFYGIGER